MPDPAGMLRLEKTADSMGSTYSIVLYGRDLARMEAAVAASFAEIRRLEEMLSTYLPASEWSLINRMASREAVRVSQESFRLLSLSLEYSRRSGGAFDISVGALSRAWGFVGGPGRIPGQAEIAFALANVGWQHVLLDGAARSVRFDAPALEIDPGGIGKGYTVDRVVEILNEHGFDTALVSASQSSIYGLGAPPGTSQGWEVDILDPWRPRKSAARVYLRDLSISTSGIGERTFWADGQLYSHIIDPRTGLPARGVASASVLAPRATDGEAWTKSCFINGRPWTEGHKTGDFSIFLCEDGPRRTCAWIA